MRTAFVIRWLLINCGRKQNLDSGTLGEMSNLENLDLSRNNIADLTNGTLSRASRLKTLHFSVNTLRKVGHNSLYSSPLTT